MKTLNKLLSSADSLLAFWTTTVTPTPIFSSISYWTLAPSTRSAMITTTPASTLATISYWTLPVATTTAWTPEPRPENTICMYKYYLRKYL